ACIYTLSLHDALPILAYCLALLLGVSREAEKARRDLEIPRRRPRHGSCRTLSVLYVALAMLSHPRWKERAYVQLQFLVGWVAAGDRKSTRLNSSHDQI